jgi:S1-C subfamily serine protease
MRGWAILLLALVMQGCSVSRVAVKDVAPKAVAGEVLPIDASLMVYVPKKEAKKKILMHYGYGQKYLHEPGKDLSNASLEVPRKYFRHVSGLSLDKPVNYVLKLTGEAKIDVIWGVYNVKLHGKLFNSSGQLVYEASTSGSTVSAVVVDDNAFYNAYVEAIKDFFDGMMASKYANIVQYVKANPAAPFAAGGPAGEGGLELVATGSGFFINKAGAVVTNQHVVSECLAVSVSLGGKESKAHIAFADKDLDVAVLETDLEASDYAHLAPAGRQVRLGEEIVTIGFPLHGVLSSSPSLSTGNISSLSGLNDDKDVIQITAPIQPGNSGGPLLDHQGRVVGMVQSKLNALRLAAYTGDIAQNVNFAVNEDALIQALDKAGVPYSTATSTAGKEVSTPDLAEQATKYTLQVMCRG